MALYQLITLLFGLLMLGKAISHFTRGDKTWRELLIWTLFWGGLVTISIFPSITRPVASFLGIIDNANAILFILVGILSFLLFSMVLKVERLERDITLLSRSIALKDKKKK